MLPKKWTLVKNYFPDYEENLDETFLIEDMFLATFNNYCIDVGWYGSWGGDKNGRFITYLIKDSNWEEPIIKIVSFKISELEKTIELCSNYIDDLISN